MNRQVPIRRNRSRLPPARRGVTLVEIVIAMGILALLVSMVMQGLIAYGRAYKSTRTQGMLQDRARYLMLRLEFLTATATRLEALDNGNTLRIVYIRTDEKGTQTFHRAEFALDTGDDKEETNQDNVIVEREVDGAGNELWRRALLPFVSRLEEEPLFETNARAARQLVELRARAGDRTNPPDRSAEEIARHDDAFTGPGFQGFVVRCSLSPAN